MSRSHYNTWARFRAVLTSPSLYELAGELDWDRPVGRPLANPAYVGLAYGALARVTRSGIRVELDLAEPATWAAAQQLMRETIRRYRLDLPPPGPRPPKWDHWRCLRNHHLATDDGLARLARVFPPVAVGAARRIGQIPATGGAGSFTHPDPTRCAYGDGTQVRPLYRPPETVLLDNDDGTTTVAYPDPRTGELLDHPPGRFDPDLQAHHGHAGPVLTHGYVCWHTRGPKPYQRIDLAAAHILEPGAEAATAVTLLRDVHRAAGNGIQAVVYDGALRGVHIDQIMRDYGYLVIAKQHTDSTSQSSKDHDGKDHDSKDHNSGEPGDLSDLRLVQTPTGRRARSLPLGTITHRLPTGAACAHQIAAAGGQVVEIDLDETGDPVITGQLSRTAVKRARRAGGHFHFNVGYELACPGEPFTVWLSPHPGKDGDTRRPEQLRVLPTGDPDTQRLYGVRSDAESFHSNYKRTLIVDRAMSLGWRRGLVDLYCFAVYNNALTEYRAAETEQATRRGTAAHDRRPMAAAAPGAPPTGAVLPDLA
jgi:hypothetical protein